MNFNENWSRWIKSSIAKHFKDCKENMYVEGFQRDTEGKKDWFELRIDGPNFIEQSFGHWKINIEIDVLILVADQEDAYRIERLVGKLSKKFDCITVKKLGESEPDDGTFVGCLERTEQPVRINNFGKVNNMNQTSIDGLFEMFLG